MKNKPVFSEAEQNILDKAGGLICQAVEASLHDLKELPDGGAYQEFTVLFEQYFSPDGPAVNVGQLMDRLKAIVDDFLSENDVPKVLNIGEQMMAILLFESKELSALLVKNVKAC